MLIPVYPLKLIYSLTNIGLLLIHAIDDTDSNFKLNDFYEKVALVMKKLTNVKKIIDLQNIFGFYCLSMRFSFK
jgi:hypothetical protein